MPANILKTLNQFYNELPVGILIFEDEKAIFSNVAYRKLLNISNSNQLGKSKLHQTLINGIVANQNKDSGDVRLVIDQKIIFFSIFRNFVEIKKHKILIVYTLIPNENRESLHKTTIRESYIFDRLRVFVPNRLVRYGAKIIPFSETEFNLFLYLIKNEDQRFSKQELYKQVWGRIYIDSRAVDITISRIRKRLAKAGCKKEYILTLHGQGYIFSVNH